jgi:hypothetical protein
MLYINILAVKYEDFMTMHYIHNIAVCYGDIMELKQSKINKVSSSYDKATLLNVKSMLWY